MKKSIAFLFVLFFILSFFNVNFVDAQTTTEPVPVCSVYNTFLKIGSRGEDVKVLQQILKDAGYYFGVVDGIYGLRTHTARINYEKKCPVVSVASSVQIDMGTPTYKSDTNTNGEVTRVTYDIPFTAVSLGKDSYIGNFAVPKESTLSKYAIAFNIENSTSGIVNMDSASAITSLNDSELTYEDPDYGVYLLRDGVVRKFNLSVSLSSPAVSDMYRVVLKQFKTFTNAELTTGAAVKTLTPASDYRTGYQFINGTGLVTTPVSTIKVLSPNGGEEWKQGSTQTIKWRDTNNTYTYNIFVHGVDPVTGEVNSRFILAEETQGPSYNWKVGTGLGEANNGLLNGTYKIQVCRSTASGNCDDGDEYFKIVNGTTKIPTITSILPPGCTAATSYSAINGTYCGDVNVGDWVYVNGANFTQNNFAFTYSTDTGKYVAIPVEFVSSSKLTMVVPKNAGLGKHAIGLKSNKDDSFESNTVSLNFVSSTPVTSLEITTQSKLPNAKAGEEYMVPLNAVGGSGSYSWGVNRGASAFPIPGLGLSSTNGSTIYIKGVPADVYIGGVKKTVPHTFTFDMSVSSGSKNVSKRFTITVDPKDTLPLEITTPSKLPNAKVGVAYAQDILASGGVSDYSWNIKSGSGSLPAGITKTSPTQCVTTPCPYVLGIYGTPTRTGIYRFTAEVESGDKKISKEFTLTVDAAPVVTPTVPPPVISSLSVTSGVVGTAVTITGSAFSPTSNTVNFGSNVIPNIPATNNGTRLFFTVPEYTSPACLYATPACVQRPGAISTGSYAVTVYNTESLRTSNAVSFSVVSSNTRTPVTVGAASSNISCVPGNNNQTFDSQARAHAFSQGFTSINDIYVPAGDGYKSSCNTGSGELLEFFISPSGNCNMSVVRACVWGSRTGTTPVTTTTTPVNPTTTTTPTPTGTAGSCSYSTPPSGCTYVTGTNYNATTNCGRVLSCPTGAGASCSYSTAPAGCSYVRGTNYNATTNCGLVLSCPVAPAKGIIEGYRVDHAKYLAGDNAAIGLNVPVYGQKTVSTGRSTFQSGASPYYFSVDATEYEFSVATPTGYKYVGYTLCVNSITCHKDALNPSPTVKINVAPGNRYDLWWHFNPIAVTAGAASNNLSCVPGNNNVAFETQARDYATANGFRSINDVYVPAGDGYKSSCNTGSGELLEFFISPSGNCNMSVVRACVWGSKTGTTPVTTTTTPTNPTTTVPTGTAGACSYSTAPAGCSYVRGTNYNATTNCGLVLSCPVAPTCSSAGPEGTTTTATTGTLDRFAYGVSSNVTSVYFPTWSDVGGQDDLIWYPGVNQGGGTWKVNVDLAKHPGTGSISTHVYMNTADKNNVWCDTANFTRTAVSVAPVACSAGPDNVSTTENSGNIDRFAYNVPSGTNAVNFAVWSEVGGQDDLVWYPGVNQGGGTWKISVNLASHPGAGLINTHVYTNTSSQQNIWCDTANFSRGGTASSASNASQMALQNATASSGAVLGVKSFNFTLPLRKGSTGNEVVELQKFLNAAGYGPVPAEGTFGPITQAAVIKFQKANGLVGDGIVGSKVRALLNK